MASPVCADVSFQYAGLSLFGPSRLERHSKRLQGAVPEGLAVAEAEGQRVGQDDAVATDQAPSPMKRLKPSDFADKAAFQKEQRRMCGVRKAEREAVAARQAAASLASAKEAKEFKDWQCHRLQEGHDWLLHLCAKVDKLNLHGAWSASRTSRVKETRLVIMGDYFRVRMHEKCLSHHEAVKRLLFEYKYMDSKISEQRSEGANSEEEESFLGGHYQLTDDLDFHVSMEFDWHAHGYEDSI
jgi:hypothetical protein